MAGRLNVIEQHILDAAVSGGLEMRAVSSNEDADFQARVKVMKEFMSSERFKHTTRPYKVLPRGRGRSQAASAIRALICSGGAPVEDVVKLQGTFPMYFNGAKVSEKLYKMLREHQAKGTCSHTFGALDTVQAGDGGGCATNCSMIDRNGQRHAEELEVLSPPKCWASLAGLGGPRLHLAINFFGAAATLCACNPLTSSPESMTVVQPGAKPKIPFMDWFKLVTQMAKYLTSVYVSGWQCSSTASTSNEPGPDVADYPYDTVPNKVDQLFRAQLFHDRKQYEERRRMSAEERAKTPVDYLNPIIADADTGHGGITATMKLAKMFIENGAAGIHIEDGAGTGPAHRLPHRRMQLLRHLSSLPRMGFLSGSAEVVRELPELRELGQGSSGEKENVLYLYAIQRVQLTPAVKEDVKLLTGGQQVVDIEWRVQNRTEAALQMRKQMLSGLRYKLSAEVLEDRPGEPGESGSVHSVTWRVPRPQNRPPLELTAEGKDERVGVGLFPGAFLPGKKSTGRTAAEADALEHLYVQAAAQPALQQSVHVAKAERREVQQQQLLEEAAQQRQQQLDAAQSQLSDAAAGELVVRHNLVVLRRRVKVKDEVLAHEAGYHCVLRWFWDDPSGEAREARVSALGGKKRIAKAEAMRRMLQEQGFEALEVSALNEAAGVRALAKDSGPAAASSACDFMSRWPPSYWSLVLLDVWRQSLALRDTKALEVLGRAVRELPREGLGPRLWESLLDAPAHVACGATAAEALRALQGTRLDAAQFPSAAHRDYFQHFRLLMAMERVGANQAMVEELRTQAEAPYLRMRQQHFVLPYLTLVPPRDWDGSLLSSLRQGDVVYLRSDERDHLAVVTTIVKDTGHNVAPPRRQEWFDVYGLESEVTAFRWSHARPTGRARSRVLAGVTRTVHFGTLGLRAAALYVRFLEWVGVVVKVRSWMGKKKGTLKNAALGREMSQIIVEAFGAPGARHLESARRALAKRPVEQLEQSVERWDGWMWGKLQQKPLEELVQKAALATGQRLSQARTSRRELRGRVAHPEDADALLPCQAQAQLNSVMASLQQRLTLIQGTGKTTAAAAVVMGWRSSGQRILCAADSNVAADQLHRALRKWGGLDGKRPGALDSWAFGIKSYRFAPAEMRKAASIYDKMMMAQDALGSFQIVVTTCASAGHDLVKGEHFQRVIIDESTQSIEPSTLLPIINGCSHLVLIGDHRQLPPTVISDDARRGGLERSLFARLVEAPQGTGGAALVEPLLLNEQRRMHPSIAEFPNQHFYQGRVRDEVPARPPIRCVGKRTPPFLTLEDALRVMLIDCGMDEERCGTSWRNAGEAEAIRRVLQHLRPNSTQGEWIAVLTPYVQQKELLKSVLADAKLQVPVSTVDGYQGAEAELILFSLVRGNSSGRLGFVRDLRRANVALTRARSGLLVFGARETLRQEEAVWDQHLGHQLRGHQHAILVPCSSWAWVVQGDQKPGTKKCGHMGGKVLVSTQDHIQRLIAIRLQADVLNSPLVLVARTDAEAATMIDSNIDPVDHPHIKGVTVKGVEPLYEAMRKGTDKDWEERSGCMTFPDAVAKALKAKGQDPAKWLQDARKMSLDQMRKAAAGMGCDIFFDWDSARSVEGYFRIKGSTEFCIERAIAFAPYADSIWMETGKPILAQATQFAKEVRAAVPHQMLAYNLSPSFNWDSAGMTDGQMESFIWDLAKLGFCWQFITLAGFHCDALNIDLFAKEYSKRGAAAYVQMIQREERKHKVETLTHQKWSGSEIVDEMGNIVSGGLSSTGIMSAGVTEKQF
ncbi:Isocitrate lyase (ICL) (Isocitrase) (Isocitratsysase) [Durusdinium trenchii]|uniref:isocitrate lyase n=1 Tax=Durusdinium trenchii TaxID=1381693 RepID=A0ABP0PQJ3_9DINO